MCMRLHNWLSTTLEREMANFLLLISASAADKVALQAINGNITRSIDATAKPLWFDPTHAGYFISCSLVAHQVMSKALQDLPPAKTQNLRELMCLEIGDDYWARPDTKISAWLNGHGVNRKAR